MLNSTNIIRALKFNNLISSQSTSIIYIASETGMLMIADTIGLPL